MARTKTSDATDSSANLGFEATAMRGSALLPREANLRSLLRSREANEAKDNRWLSTL